MRLSSLADYAVVMLSAAARHENGARLTATVLAEETGVPLPTAQRLMSRLTQAGLLKSARGTGGGVRLARSR
jgi:Rrf2 family protein